MRAGHFFGLYPFIVCRCKYIPISHLAVTVAERIVRCHLFLLFFLLSCFPYSPLWAAICIFMALPFVCLTSCPFHQILNLSHKLCADSFYLNVFTAFYILFFISTENIHLSLFIFSFRFNSTFTLYGGFLLLPIFIVQHCVLHFPVMLLAPVISVCDDDDDAEKWRTKTKKKKEKENWIQHFIIIYKYYIFMKVLHVHLQFDQLLVPHVLFTDFNVTSVILGVSNILRCWSKS